MMKRNHRDVGTTFPSPGLCQSVSLTPWYWAVAGLLLCLGCGGGRQDSEPTTSSNSEALRCANALTTGELVINTLTANRKALTLLPKVPLASTTFKSGSPYPPLDIALHEDRARKFMRYFVSCALGSDQDPVIWDDPFPPHGHFVFRGRVGLCRQWATGPFPVPPACLQRVSACVLARNNQEGKRVPISMRGRAPGISVLQSTIPTDEHQVLSNTLVASFSDCASPLSGAARNCGWVRNRVGTCTPGALVTVAAGSRRPDTCSGSVIGSTSTATVLRVCDGIYGCDSGDPRHLGSSDPNRCPPNTGPAVQFICRASTGDPTVGNFSVMVGPLVSGGTVTATVGARSSNPIRYPAPERLVFPFVEGAFYGNIFDASKLNNLVLDVFVNPDTTQILNEEQVIPLDAGPVFTNMWACYAREWSSKAAYMTHRVCALPNANCAAAVTGVCFPPGQCLTENGIGIGDFEVCRDSLSAFWLNPITTFLNEPCDVLASKDRAFCGRVHRDDDGDDDDGNDTDDHDEDDGDSHDPSGVVTPAPIVSEAIPFSFSGYDDASLDTCE